MSLKILIAPGHGIQPNGNYDAGATFKEPDGTVLDEHEFNREVTLHCELYLRNRGINVVVEQSGFTGRKAHDPNWVGTLKTLRDKSKGIGLGIEIHHDYSLAKRGGFAILPRGKWNRSMDTLARSLSSAYLARGLAVRHNYADVRGLGFLRTAPCPTIIWECSRMESTAHSVLIDRGNALGLGIINWLKATGQD